MNVFLTGGTGFTGERVLARLRARGDAVRCLVRSEEKAGACRATGATAVLGDLADGDRLAAGMAGCDTLIHVASMGFGQAPGVVAAAERAGVRRAVFVSTTGIFTQLNAASKRVRVEAEEAVRRSGLAWTLVRPTMIYGSARDRNICRLIRYIRRWPVLPVFGPGRSLMQPVYVEDLAAGIVGAAVSPVAIGREYNLPGAQSLTYNELVHTVARLMGRRVQLLHLPAGPFVAALRGTEGLGLRLPLKAEQIQRLNEDKAFSWDEARKDFGYSPRTLAEGLKEEIASMGIPLVAG